jgi:RsiW-degrading membrane proteinase PrsW (M82 family)
VVKLSKKQWFILLILVLTFVAMGGILGFVFASLLSFVPAYFYLKSIRDSEKADVEPWETIGLAFVWGALSGVFLAGIFNALGTAFLLVMLVESDAYSLEDIENLTIVLTVVVIAPIVEEFVKPLIMFRNTTVRNEIDEVEDGIVYGAACGLGFGATENVLYGLSEGAVSAGIWGIFLIVLLRTFSSILLHLVATSFTGYGIAKYQVEGQSFSIVVKYYLLAVFIHAAWNGLAIYSIQFDSDVGGLLLFAASIMLAISGLEMAKRKIRALDVAGSNIIGTDIRAGYGNEDWSSNKWERSSGWEQKKLSSSSVDTGDYNSNRSGNTVDALYESSTKTPQEMATATTNWAVNFDWRGAIGFVIFLLFILSDIIL